MIKNNPQKQSIRIYLILGNACNLSCKYCMPHKYIVSECENSRVADKVIKMIEEQAENCDQTTVIFYGGEPLLYFNSIKGVVERLGKKVQYATMTNGKALTKETVDYFNENEFEINLSYDGYNTRETRGYDPLQDNLENVLNLDCVWITSCLTTKAYPLELCSAFNDFDKVYFERHGYHARFNIALVTNPNVNNELYKYDYERIEKEMAYINDCFVTQNTKNSGAFLYGTRLASIIHRNVMLPNVPKRISIDVDSQGNLYMCALRRETKVTDVDNFGIYQKITKRMGYEERCKNCPVFPLCVGGCPYIDDVNEQCKLRRAFYMPTIKAMLLEQEDGQYAWF